LSITSPIKAVLFDFGGVFTLSPFGAVEAVARERNLDPMHFAELVFGPYHLDTDHPWHRLERGEISLDESHAGIAEVGRQHGVDVDLWHVLGKMAEANGGAVVNQQVIDLLTEVKQSGYHTAIVTNNVKEFSDAWQSMIPMHCVDVVIDSAFEGIRKPNPAIYQKAVRALSDYHGIELEPEHCIFLDDVESNVASALNTGMQGIVVTPDPNETVRQLWKSLKLEKPV
jgi:epoxide hydrolase-like predicted phosphatase